MMPPALRDDVAWIERGFWPVICAIRVPRGQLPAAWQRHRYVRRQACDTERTEPAAPGVRRRSCVGSRARACRCSHASLGRTNASS
jgi:hypothetical protein